MSPTRVIAVAAVLAAPAGRAAAAELARAADFDALCAYSETVDTAFSVFSGGPDVEPEPDPELTPPSAEVPAEIPPAFGSEPAAEPTGPDPVLQALRAREYARARLDAIMETYDVVIDAASFPLWTWDPELGSIAANTGADLEVFGPTRLLSPVVPEPLLFPMSEHEAEIALAAQAMGSASVRLTVALGARDRPWQAICRTDDLATRVDVRIVSAELVDAWGPEPAARAETVAWEAERVRSVASRQGLAASGRPTVEVMSMEIEAPVGCTSDEATVLQAGMESLLSDCYLTGLDRNANLHGAIVFGFALEPDGAVSDPRVEIDVLDDDRVRDCALAALDRMDIPRRADAAPATVRSRVRFALAE